MTELSLGKLAEPFPADDIEWRVSRAGKNRNGETYCHVLADITARAIMSRLDEVVGPENWKNESLTCPEVQVGVFAMQAGISIRVGDEWVTKWDVSLPTKASNIDSAKGGFSGAMKRAGAQWGIGRYLYHLDETFAEVGTSGGQDWNWAKLPEKSGGESYYWKPPNLPSWALPKEAEHEVSKEELTQLKKDWRDKFAAGVKSPAELLEGFDRFVESVVGDFPASDHTCWTQDALSRCRKRIESTEDPGGVDSNVPFD